MRTGEFKRSTRLRQGYGVAGAQRPIKQARNARGALSFLETSEKCAQRFRRGRKWRREMRKLTFLKPSSKVILCSWRDLEAEGSES